MASNWRQRGEERHYDQYPGPVFFGVVDVLARLEANQLCSGKPVGKFERHNSVLSAL
jgi:hypothetical protein